MASSTEPAAFGAKPDLAGLFIATVCGVTFTLIGIYLLAAPMTKQIAGARDFVVYWATGQRLVNHANPYDQPAMAGIEHAAGLPAASPGLLMRNPPWGLPLALPLGLLDVRIALFLWSPILLGCLALSVRMIREMYCRKQNYLHWLGLSFAPAISCLIAGQLSMFALMGLVLFLRWHRERPFLAGTSLWFCLLKPHLFLPFGVVLALWLVVSGSYRVLAGAAASIAASCAFVWWIDPEAWAQYAQMLHVSGIEREFIPCISVALHLWISPQIVWLQYLPSAAACVWAVAYFWPRRHTWDWMRNGSPLMMVSILLAPYCWLFDQVLLIPALIDGAYRTRSRALLALLAAASLVMEIGWMCGVKLPSPLYLWSAPAWLAWYLVAQATARMPLMELTSQPPEFAPQQP